nr:glycosyltransferase [Rosistilla ulvae]
MLSEACLNVKPLRKRVAWNLYQQRDLRFAAVIHATSEAERDDCMRRGLTQAIEIVPNGCDLPPDSALPLPRAFPVGRGKPFAIALGRIDPVKGLDVLVEAWHQAAPLDWPLVIAGAGEWKYVQEVKHLIAVAGLSERVHLIGEVDEQQKWSMLAAAGFLVNASRSENFGLAIAEALASGTPVVATQGTPWQIVQRERCGWWVEGTCAGIADAIRQATALADDQRNQMGQRGRLLVSTQFAWSSVAAKMLACYEQALR